MTTSKGWPMCEKHNIFYYPSKGCYSCKKENAKYMKTLNEVFKEMEDKGLIPKVRNGKNNNKCS